MFLKKIFVLFVAAVSIEAFNEILEKNVYRFKPTVCRTNDCNIMANVIRSAMNATADPCDDFYEYACGAWIHSNETLPRDRAMWNRIAMANKNVSEKLRTILESNNVDKLPVQKAKQWYRSCMDEESLENRGIQPLTSIVTAVGGWPIAMALGQWNPSDYSWQEIELYYSRLTGSYAMYNIDASMSWTNGSQKKISLKPPSLPLSKILQVRRNFFDPNDREPYDKLIAGVARAFATAQDARVSDEKIAKEVKDMIEFEIKLDKIRDHDAIAEGNLSVLQQHFFKPQMPNSKISNINVLKLVRNLFEGIGGIEITEDETITVHVFYILELGILLNETSFRTIVNYVHWHYVSSLLHKTNFEMRNLLFEFMKQTMGIRMALPRWEDCVNQMELKHALSYQFVLKHFTEDTYNSGSEMILNIRTEIERQMNESTWMDEETKELFRDKLRNVKTLIGFPQWYNNVTNLDAYYEGLAIDNDYFNNAVNYMRFVAKKMFRNLRVEDSEPEWFTDPITVNAYYNVALNSLNIPAADLQPPLFTPMMPDAVKYGIIGSIIGHELSHGFDDTTYNYDKNGKLINWPESMTGSYSQRTRCFVDQYENLTRDDSTIEKSFDGSHTAGENIADTMGILSVLGAYKSVVRKNFKGDRKLPGLVAFNNQQLFLLSYATTWCEVSTPQYVRKRLISKDPHSSSRVRTLATLSNTEEFAEAFKCPKGSPMNPVKKCNIWIGDSDV